MKFSLNKFQKVFIYFIIFLHFLYVAWFPLIKNDFLQQKMNDRILPTWYVETIKNLFNIKEKLDKSYLNQFSPKHIALYGKNWSLFAFSPAERFHNIKVYAGKYSEIDTQNVKLLYDSQLNLYFKDRNQDSMHGWKISHGFPKPSFFPVMADFARFFVNSYERENSLKVNDYFLIREINCIKLSFLPEPSKPCGTKIVKEWSKND